MTVNDENSVYVGGLPYDCTEEELRRAFDFCGRIDDVKIINDRNVGGKCYGFITFTNPRSAVHAIEEMDGRMIGGRIVRVNDVRTRGARSNFHRDNFRRDAWRDNNFDRARFRERDHIRDREHFQDKNNERYRDHDREGEREFESGHDVDQGRDHDREHSRDWDSDHDRDMEKSKDHDNGRETEKELHLRRRTEGHLSDHKSREMSPNSSDDYHNEIKEQMEIAVQTLEERQKEHTLIKGKIEEKEQLVANLLRKCQKLEDALGAAKKLTSQRQSTLAKIYRCYLQAEETVERLKVYEKELQSFVDSTKGEVDVGDDIGTTDCSI